MGVGSSRSRGGVAFALLIGGVVLAGGLAGSLTACQPLYGEKPDKLPSVSKKAHDPKADAAAEPQIKDVDDCTADFHGDAKAAHPNPSQAAQLTTDGDSALASADKTAVPVERTNFLKEAVDRYRSALLKDPYNPDATLKLAIAYDHVYRKGCAIAMLKRLSSLTANPKFATRANQDIESIGDNAKWFSRYRKDALAAVGR